MRDVAKVIQFQPDRDFMLTEISVGRVQVIRDKHQLAEWQHNGRPVCGVDDRAADDLLLAKLIEVPGRDETGLWAGPARITLRGKEVLASWQSLTDYEYRRNRRNRRR